MFFLRWFAVYLYVSAIVLAQPLRAGDAQYKNTERWADINRVLVGPHLQQLVYTEPYKVIITNPQVAVTLNVGLVPQIVIRYIVGDDIDRGPDYYFPVNEREPFIGGCKHPVLIAYAIQDQNKFVLHHSGIHYRAVLFELWQFFLQEAPHRNSYGIQQVDSAKVSLLELGKNIVDAKTNLGIKIRTDASPERVFSLTDFTSVETLFLIHNNFAIGTYYDPVLVDHHHNFRSETHIRPAQKKYQPWKFMRFWESGAY